ncbi:spore cortex biosynthesis protein YabQ [Gracilibacillus kekensis]|uniref:Spore cortex biosynthesis protein YabQ n=1 Tax=Gracilibacillus kekensis TaxID=1027249 RepID=A0A1M7QZA7_9BACI|nr:spore cortex biosynthesis protein YabQ [Gracilibacillus kekensis]SHN37458.1 spore cortex biosynthesis protein YabQ [Gracilibacillus kekensis]
MTLSTQFITMITMILSGVYLGASYHTFKRLERLWLTSITWKYLLEILFWLLQAVVLYVILFLINEGILRFYVFLAVICGYAMFKSLFEQVFSRVIGVVFRILHDIYRFIYRTIELLIVKPVVFIITVLFVCITRLFTIIITILVSILKAISWPFKMIFTALAKLIPKNAQKYLHPFYRIYSKIKNKD